MKGLYSKGDPLIGDGMERGVHSQRIMLNRTPTLGRVALVPRGKIK